MTRDDTESCGKLRNLLQLKYVSWNDHGAGVNLLDEIEGTW